MNAIYQYLQTLFNGNRKSKGRVTCNYANNYYGDQCCQLTDKT